MTKTIVRLKAIFDEIGLPSAAAFERLSKVQRSRLDSAVYGWFANYRDEHVSMLELTPGLNLCMGIKKKVSAQLTGTSMDTVVKKLSFFSQTGVLLTPDFRHPGCRRNVIPDVWYHLVLDHMPMLEAGILAILPRGMKYLAEDRYIEGETFLMLKERPRTVEKRWFLFEHDVPSLRVIDISAEALRREMLEIYPDRAFVGKPAAYIRLPFFRNISSGLLISLRRDHGDIFADYNRTIQGFFANTSKAKTEARLIEVILTTDEEIRRIDSELKKLSGSQTFKLCEIGVEATLAILCTVSGSTTAQLVAALAVGGGLVPQVGNYIGLTMQKRSLPRTTPFYFPWMLHTEATRLPYSDER